MRIDAHHHLWDPATAEYEWMTDAVAPIRRRFDVDDLRSVARGAGINGTVAVQARCDTDETRELLSAVGGGSPVVGVVGWIDLTRPDKLATQVQAFRAEPNGSALVGIRHLVQDEPDPEWLLRDDVQRSIEMLGREDLAYDFVVRPPQLTAAVATATAHPGTRFVLDHIGKPRIAAGPVDPEWAEGVERLARLPNVWCKLSGLVTEAAWHSWTAEDFRGYVESVCAWFGDERLMFGSDWPVCLLAASYDEVLDTLLSLLAETTESVRDRVFGRNAVSAYGLAAAEP